jgi:diguanylate cyclase (GGDEF)-like protein
LQAELIEARDRLRIEATHDALTDLLNRRAIMELLDREVERAHREQLDLSVVMLDLDHFKMVNDQLGHSAGDEVLRDSAALLRRLLRSYDAIGRYGGEEFIVVLPGCDLETAQFVAERLRAALAAHTVAFDELSIPVTASFGAAALQMRQDSCELVRRADSAMYRAKKRGRNCVACDGADGVLQAV